jgi:hypothetical protein
MTDDELRRLVRDAVARHLGRSTPPVPVLREPGSGAVADAPWQSHPSHHQYLAVVNTTSACVIEPSVACDHCGYCKSHGH